MLIKNRECVKTIFFNVSGTLRYQSSRHRELSRCRVADSFYRVLVDLALLPTRLE